MIYFDNAATTSPKPGQVIDAACRAVGRFTANPGRSGHPMAAECSQAIYDARRTVGEFFGTDNPEQVVFTPGCTYSINFVLKGSLNPGDHIIISNLEHNAVVRPLHTLQKHGISVSRARVFENDPDATLRSFRGEIRKNTRMIFITHASNVFGIRLPVERIGELCRERGLMFGIDAAQSAGVVPITLESAKADFICVPAHKGLYGIMGAGALILSEREKLRPVIEGGTGSMSALRDQPQFLPDRLESGTANVVGICAMAAGVRWVSGKGIDTIAEHEMAAASQLYRRMSKIDNVVLYTQEPVHGQHVPVISFNIGDLASEKTGELLAQRGVAVRAGLHCAYDAHLALGTHKRGTVRLCPSAFSSQKDIDGFIKIVAELAG